MQVSINPINATLKEVLLTVEPERIEKYYKKYLSKAAKEVVVPGFRKGKAPLTMVERMYADRIEDYFQKDVVDDVFTEAAKEHNIEYLLYPEVKDITWEKGSEMVIKIEIETEPDIDFKELEQLKVPYKPIELANEVEKYIEDLRQDHGTMVDVESAMEDDEVASEISIVIDEIPQTFDYTLYAGETKPIRSYPELLGAKTGDVVDLVLSGKLIAYGFKELQGELDPDADYPAKVMVNSILRKQVPALDDDFAKDLEFDTLEAMRAKVADDMRLKNEHMNINVKNNALISKLYVDNNFELPMKTLEHLAQQQVERITDENLKNYYLYQIKMQIAQEMIHVYVMRNLRKVVNLELTDEIREEYMIHEAILDDKTLEAWKEANKEQLSDKDYDEVIQNYAILKSIADKSEFFIPEPEEEAPVELGGDEEITEAEFEEIKEEAENQE